MSLPDIVTDPNAVLKDDVAWRFKRAPDYSKTRKWYEESESGRNSLRTTTFLPTALADRKPRR